MKTLGLTIGLLLVAAALQAQAPDGKALYEKNCKMCHGADGKPNPAMLKMMPGLAPIDARFLAARSEDSVVKVLTQGTANGKMKGYKGKLSPAEMVAVAKYLRELAKGGPQ